MLPTKPKIKRAKTADEALASLMRLCARAERSSGDAIRLMRGWGVAEAEQAGVLQRLLRERFIDDRRYAEAFVREKCGLSAWGHYKILAALKRKGISDTIINDVLSTLSPEENKSRLTEKLQRKIKSVKYDNAYQLKTKLIRYALSLGFTMSEVMESVDEIIKQNDIKECDEEIFF
ncbi:MAG: RecX family transcriptional regulator [Alistipes sp.]|nr:RecX family transcriptional regulator [Alistipes sp.]